jgi:hypothetical protein
MPSSSDSIMSLFLSQPLLMWTFLLGFLVLATAVTLNIILAIRRKKGAGAKAARPQAAPQPAETAVSQPESAPPAPPEAAAAPKPSALASLQPIASETHEAANHAAPEVDSRLAELFQHEIIVDRQVQALRDSLPPVAMTELVAQLRQVAEQMRQIDRAAETAVMERID